MMKDYRWSHNTSCQYLLGGKCNCDEVDFLDKKKKNREKALKEQVLSELNPKKKKRRKRKKKKWQPNQKVNL